MEKMLEKIFDYQRFEGCTRLSRLIEETESRYEGRISDEDLMFVNAAGRREEGYTMLAGDDRDRQTMK